MFWKKKPKPPATPNPLPRNLNGYQLVTGTDGITRITPKVYTDRNINLR